MPLDAVTEKVVTADFSGIGKQAGKTDMSISAQWASRPMDERHPTKESLMSYLLERDSLSSSHIMRIGDLRPVLDGDQVCFDIGGGEILRPTNYSFQQIGQEFGVPTGFMRQALNDAPRLVVDILEHSHRKVAEPDKQVGLYRARRNIRGVTGPNYGRILDSELAQALFKACDESGSIWEVPTAFLQPGDQFECVDVTQEATTLYASDRDIVLLLVDQRNPIQAGFVTDPRTGERVPDLYFRGIVVRQGECGGVGLTISTFLYRWICANRSIREQKGFEKVVLAHRSGARDAFYDKLVPALRAFVNGGTVGIADGLMRAKDAQLVRSDEEAQLRLTATFGFAPDVAAAIVGRAVEHESPMRSAFDFVREITAAAKAIPHQDKRLLLERQASDIFKKIGAFADA